MGEPVHMPLRRKTDRAPHSVRSVGVPRGFVSVHPRDLVGRSCDRPGVDYALFLSTTVDRSWLLYRRAFPPLDQSRAETPRSV
jgi:hypothetical protein